MTKLRSTPIERTYGVDFSGAMKAGTKIWIASGVIGADGLRIEDCRPAYSMFEVRRDRSQSLAALREFIAAQGPCVFGMDFPFGLPLSLVEGDSWRDLVLTFADRYRDHDEFRDSCRRAAVGGERKRLTDRENRAPFSPYNLRLFRQTYYGIRDVLAPLVRAESVSVLPMMPAVSGKPWLLEVCPASTLRLKGIDFRYKGRGEGRREARQSILEVLQRTVPVLISAELRSVIVNDREGDALDSIVAAIAASRSLQGDLGRLKEVPGYRIEGYIYS